MAKIHLISNAHIDPMWLWQWEEGAAEALATFRTAVELCEENDCFIFNHNEAILYKWVEEYDPELFLRIKNQVQCGKWHMMGGWFLQPDCNMPSGESYVRQIMAGRRYFKDRFHVSPSTAINFDSFGHSRGLVQIMKKAGYDSYIVCRPDQISCPTPGDTFLWTGYDGSEVVVYRACDHYLTRRGEVVQKIKNWIKNNPNKSLGMILWGVGNHGGGPSRKDLADIEALACSETGHEIIHSTPEAYFTDSKSQSKDLIRFNEDLNPYNVGCYTSQVRVKQKYRSLENQIFLTEKMLSSACINGLASYPSQELEEAINSMITAQFHDVLPGSSIQRVEEDAIRLLDHGLEIMSKLKARAFFALMSGQKHAEPGEIPIFVYNPHPYRIKRIIECELNIPDQNWDDTYTLPSVYMGNSHVPSQVEKEDSNIPIDWRKKLAFQTELEPSQMNRFSCRLEKLPRRPSIGNEDSGNELRFTTNELDIVVNVGTGLIDSYKVHGREFLGHDAFLPLVIVDNDDSWGGSACSFTQIDSKFRLMSDEESMKFAGTDHILKPVHIIEDGAVRTMIEVFLVNDNSCICQTYKFPKHGTEIEVNLRVFWNKKTKMLKLSIPTFVKAGYCLGQAPFGVCQLPNQHTESVAQKWTGIFSDSEDAAITCINDGTYGSDYQNGEMRFSLLRSPGYSAHTIANRQMMPQDRFSARIDQGERVFRFWINGGDYQNRIDNIEREALIHNEEPFALSCFPSGKGKNTLPLIVIDDDSVVMTAFKIASDGSGYVFRLFESTGRSRSLTVHLPILKTKIVIKINKYEIKSYFINLNDGTLREVDLMENAIPT